MADDIVEEDFVVVGKQDTPPNEMGMSFVMVDGKPEESKSVAVAADNSTNNTNSTNNNNSNTNSKNKQELTLDSHAQKLLVAEEEKRRLEREDGELAKRLAEEESQYFEQRQRELESDRAYALQLQNASTNS